VLLRPHRPSDAAKESVFVLKWNPKNEIANFSELPDPEIIERAHFRRPQPFAAAAFETVATLGGDTNDTNSTLSDIGPIRMACIVIALEAGNGLLIFLKLVFSRP
jgi:hypothetical protein